MGVQLTGRRAVFGFLVAVAIACTGFTAPVGQFKRAGTGQLNLWVVGDSIADGKLETSPGVYIESGGLRTRLYADFTAPQKVLYNFVGTLDTGPGSPTLPNGHNDGHSGWWTADLGNMLGPAGTGVSDILSHIPTWMPTLGRIDVTVIQVATNSVVHCFSLDTSPSDPGYPVFTYAVPPGAGIGACWSGYIGPNPSAPTIFAFQADVTGAQQKTAAQIVSVVAAIHAINPACRVFVNQIPPVVGYENTITQVNAQLASQLSGVQNAVYVATNLNNTTDLGPDQEHPTTAGYNKIGDADYAALP